MLDQQREQLPVPTAPLRPVAQRSWAQPLLAGLEARLSALPVGTAVRLPGGVLIGPEDARVALMVHEKSALALLATGQIGALASAYVEGHLDIEGDIHDVAEVAAALAGNMPLGAGQSAPSGPARAWRALRSRRHHSLKRDRRQIEFHYDLSNDFYALWLDPRRVYSCAYWPRGVNTLAAAQEAKLDLICRKLMLKPGERFLDVGAGWGGLLLWAAEHYGVQAHGITLSKQQHAYVQQLVAARGLQDRVTMELRDYRELPDEPCFDKIASVGMFEHVGQAQLVGYFRKLRRLLRPGGLLLNHGITAHGLHANGLGAGIGEFIERYIFPGGELVHISRVMAALAEAGLESLDVESLRPHYARTLWAWSEALESRLDEARALCSERVLRAYRLYLAGCAIGFERRWMALHQIVASRPSGIVQAGTIRGAQSDYPFQRDHVYAAGPAEHAVQVQVQEQR